MDHTRHSGIFDANNLHVVLVGAGGIGSATGLGIAKMGVASLDIWDFDKIDVENISTQMYPVSGVGSHKAFALVNMLEIFADDVDFEAFSFAVEGSDVLNGHIVISAVDSIAARKAIWEAAKRGNQRYYLDARMSSEVFQLFAVDMQSDTSWYEGLLKDQHDEDIPDEPCTAKATIYTALFAAGRIGHAVKQIANGHKLPRILIDSLNDYSLVTI